GERRTLCEDNQTKKIQDNITRVEKHFREMCQLRDKGDLFSTLTLTETPDLKRGMKVFADHLAKIQDCRHAQVKRLEAKVVEPLKTHGAVVRRKREDVKMTQSAIDKETKQEAQLEKTRLKNPSDRQIIVSFHSFFHDSKCVILCRFFYSLCSLFD
uniref:Uncharacterized protein n=1 Tax=Oryzias latipes TaxID=8090 RepID=A0A3P9KD55_ORYLA